MLNLADPRIVRRCFFPAPTFQGAVRIVLNQARKNGSLLVRNDQCDSLDTAFIHLCRALTCFFSEALELSRTGSLRKLYFKNKAVGNWRSVWNRRPMFDRILNRALVLFDEPRTMQFSDAIDTFLT